MSELRSVPLMAMVRAACRSSVPLTMMAPLRTTWLAIVLVMVAVMLGASGNPTLAQDQVRFATLNPGQDLSGIYGPLPNPLSASDVRTYREIFVAQGKGRWRTADKLIAAIDNDILLGHVLAQRYLHPTAYRSRFNELRAWLDEYADHPQASRIYKLAKKRQPNGARNPRQPVAGYLGGSGQELQLDKPAKYVSKKQRTAAQNRAVRKWKAQVRRLVERDRPTQARELLRNKKMRAMLDQYEYDWALWTIAKGYYANRKDELAYQFASTAADRSGVIEPMINWTAGLAAFRAKLYAESAQHFVRLVGSRETTDEQKAGAAFWAARSFLLSGQAREVGRYLRVAAQSSDQFYGILAQALLGSSIVFDWHETGLKNDTIELLNRYAGSRRAIALGQVGRLDSAESEIRKLAARAEPPLAHALVALAQKLDLPAAQMRVAQRLRIMDGRRHDGAMFPIPSWSQSADIEVDPALLLAITRAESAFNRKAVSGAGARGLMQIMPSTARDMAKRNAGLRYKGKYHLHDPMTNIRFGQAYIQWLNETDLVGDNLMYMLMAYNAGPKRVQRWRKEFREIGDDPILFLESIPIRETRNYVKKVMANLWAYRAQMEMTTPSLIELAENSWPAFSSLTATNQVAQVN